MFSILGLSTEPSRKDCAAHFTATSRGILTGREFKFHLAPVMDDQLLSTQEAARRLGISVLTIYGWLDLSNRGLLVIRGQQAVIGYLQGGPKGQGRIKISAGEVERVKELMRVRPRLAPIRRPPTKNCFYPGITVQLGRPPR